MSQADSSPLARYLRHRRAFEIFGWGLLGLTIGTANALVSIADLGNHRQEFSWIEPFIWEYTSVGVVMALMPLLLRFERIFPLRLETWRRSLVAHVLATIPFAVLHVSGMVWSRQLIYWLLGGRYDFGNWMTGFAYEYLKDARSYAFLFTVVYLYRLVLLRLQGEARVLTAPDEGPPVAAIEQPENFLVKKLGAEFLIAAHDIEWLEAAENYVNLHVRGRVYPLRSTMAAIQERLDPKLFIRVHRSFIVNVDRVEHIETLEAGDARLTLKDGAKVPCSRRYRQALMNLRATAQAEAT